MSLAPIAAGFVSLPNVNVELIAGALLGGAMFGDNLSFISDTTIAATQSQGCEMKDKFRMNGKIALPASVLTVLILIVVGGVTSSQWTFTQPRGGIYTMDELTTIYRCYYLGSSWAQCICYFYHWYHYLRNIRFLAMVLFEVLGYCKTVYDGFASMNDIFLVFSLYWRISSYDRERRRNLVPY